MTIDPEVLAAYADGELGREETARIEAAIAADPALAQAVEAHRALRRTLSAHFAPILAMPVPERLTNALMPRDNVVDLAAARQSRQESNTPRWTFPHWATGGALAASLALGLVLGGQLQTGRPISSRDGKLVASGALEKALTTQLASAQSESAPVHILLSFQAKDGRYCRGFEEDATAGIACRADGDWAIVRTQASKLEASSGGYRQAGSSAAEIMVAAQDMAAGGALDADAERAARKAGWHR